MAGDADTTEHGWPRRAPVPHDVALDLLTGGEFDVVGRMPWSSNATYLVDLVDDAHRLLAVYKPTRGERPLWDFPAGTLSRREVAAFALSEALGWDLVPETVMRADGPAGEGSLQRFIDHDPEQHYFSLLEAGGHDDVLRRFAIFDVVANNTDRKAGHLVVDADGHIWGIDHGVCFHAQTKLRTVIWDFGGEPIGELCADLERVATRFPEALAPQLATLLSPFEIDAVRGRLEQLLARGRLPSVDPGYHSYPWPLV